MRSYRDTITYFKNLVNSYETLTSSKLKSLYFIVPVCYIASTYGITVDKVENDIRE